jgi:hypothetical protein
VSETAPGVGEDRDVVGAGDDSCARIAHGRALEDDAVVGGRTPPNQHAARAGLEEAGHGGEEGLLTRSSTGEAARVLEHEAADAIGPARGVGDGGAPPVELPRSTPGDAELVEDAGKEIA